MSTLELESTNQKFALAAADNIEINGLAKMQYHDRDTGCYCVLGAFRMLVFGTIWATAFASQGERMLRYLDLVKWFAEKVEPEGLLENANSETVVSIWSDGSTKEVVVAKLREVGRAAALTQEV